MARKDSFIICISDGPFKPGDPPPSGYGDRIEWAGVQYRAGLRQVRRQCGRVHFPQEICTHEARRT